MPKFRNEETRLRGFNGNLIQFGPGETKDLSDQQLDMLAKDPTFEKLIIDGDLRDLDGAFPAAKQRVQSQQKKQPAQDNPAAATLGLQSGPQFAPNALGVPVAMPLVGPAGGIPPVLAQAPNLTGVPQGGTVQDVFAAIAASTTKDQLAAINNQASSLPPDQYAPIGEALAKRSAEIDAQSQQQSDRKSKRS